MNKIISFSLFGKNDFYHEGAILNALASKKVFTDWELRYYISEEISNNLEEKLLDLGAKTIRKKRVSINDFQFYRFLPLQENYYDAVIVRDVDSILDERDEWVVNEWLKSNKPFHIIRDHPNHLNYILAGMFGYRPKSKKINNIENLIRDWQDFISYGADQHFLANKIYPMIRNDVYIHSDFIAFGDEEVEPIKFKRENLSWIGKRFCNEKKSNEDFLKEKIKLGLRRLPLIKYKLTIQEHEYSNSKFVVLKGAEGFCDRLQCLLQAIEYASQTQRVLVIDWRDKDWCHDPLIQFAEYFEINGVKTIDIETFIKFFNKNYESIRVFPEAWSQVLDDSNFLEFINCKKYKIENILTFIEISNGIKNDFEEEIVVYPGKGLRKSTYFLANCLDLSDKLNQNIFDFSFNQNLYHKSYDVIHLRGGSKKWLGGEVSSLSPVKNLHEQWINVEDYFNPIWEIYSSLNSSLPLYLMSDSSKLIELWLEKYNCGIVLPNSASTKLRGCGIHKLQTDDLLELKLSKKEINFECIRDFIIMLNSNFLIGDDVSLFSKVAFEIKKLGIFITKFPEKENLFKF